MVISIYDRLNFAQFFPETGNILTQMIVRDIIKKTEITPEEKEVVGFKIENEGKSLKWDKEVSRDIDFSSSEIQFLKNQVEKMDKENKINQKNLDICLAIKNWKKEEPKKEEAK